MTPGEMIILGAVLMVNRFVNTKQWGWEKALGVAVAYILMFGGIFRIVYPWAEMMMKP